MLDMSLEKIARIIVKGREYDAKVAAWDGGGPEPSDHENDGDSILEGFADDATRRELFTYIAEMNEDERAQLVALAWIGRGSFGADEFSDAVDEARSEHARDAARYLLGMPLLPDYLEQGLDEMGISVEDAEHGIL